MKFSKFLITAFLILAVSVAYSQEIKKTGGYARLAGMGSNPYVIDPFFNTVNPAWNAVYNNFVIGDLGSSAGAPFSAGGYGQYLAGSFQIGDAWTLGGILARNDFNGMSIALLDPGSNSSSTWSYPGVVSTVNGIAGVGSVVPLDNNLEVIGTYSFSRTKVGLGIAYAHTSNDVNPPTGGSTEGSASQFGFNLGVISDLTRSLKLDIGASLVLPSTSYKPDTLNETSASQTIITVNGRAFWKLNNKLKLVPLILFSTESGSIDSGGISAASVDMPSFTWFEFGVGLNYQIGDFLIAGGAIFSTSSLTYPAVNNVSPELSLSETRFPIWNIGVEWNMLEWFVGRLGYVASSGSRSYDVPNTATSKTEYVQTFFGPSQMGATVGVGFRFGDFSLDATVNEDVLRQGFNTIGGGGPTFAYLTASYALP
ncbi:MAG: hypothetical protein OQJ93_12910 [Ignavibacteriaceae bacterium]|jgi:hypothetical protein|nr:hypothetical protein [Ignavibacteriaceae bacterium]MCW8814080.1 hypothetical protein [Chlorobium sp.]MCW8816674.1 hypothetical protein [Ignavibacteriaceae bacterium]MCW8995821.1 hypothetical protein [Psychromonas sp.]MCW9098279.1 hypothetical protein [Ignavibacteriaceae bacterium]